MAFSSRWRSRRNKPRVVFGLLGWEPFAPSLYEAWTTAAGGCVSGFVCYLRYDLVTLKRRQLGNRWGFQPKHPSAQVPNSYLNRTGRWCVWTWFGGCNGCVLLCEPCSLFPMLRNSAVTRKCRKLGHRWHFQPKLLSYRSAAVSVDPYEVCTIGSSGKGSHRKMTYCVT